MAALIGIRFVPVQRTKPPVGLDMPAPPEVRAILEAGVATYPKWKELKLPAFRPIVGHGGEREIPQTDRHLGDLPGGCGLDCRIHSRAGGIRLVE